MATPEPPGILVLGGINMDLVTVSQRFPSPGETVVGSRFLTYPGGKGANQAVAAARMGGRVFMVGRVGTDAFGDQLLDGLRRNGVDVTAIGRSDTTSGIAVINIDGSGQNRIIQVLGANDTCGEEEAEQIDRLLPHCSVALLQLEVSPDLSLRVAQSAYRLGKCVIFDPGPVREIPDEFFRFCTCITPNETEAEALAGFPVHDEQSAIEAAGILSRRGAESAIIKMGEQGAVTGAMMGGILGFRHTPVFPVTAVDSVGAGDAFNGALAVAAAEGLDLELPDAVRMASAAGALSVTRRGAQDSMPYRHEVEALLKSSGT